MNPRHAEEVGRGGRFEFGANWAAFLSRLDEGRIQSAEQSVRRMLGAADLAGRTFLDIGSGSGLFSLAARRLGAVVVSFDFDPRSVACAEELRRRYRPGDGEWRIEEGSVLDPDYLASLGRFDIVYSWGVLHHTGNLRRAIEAAAGMVKEGGSLCIAVYNDQGAASARWLAVKKLYNRLPRTLRPFLVFLVAAVFELRYALARLLHGKNPLPFEDWRAKRADRGMSAWRDWVDWCGGLPFEVAGPEEVVEQLRPLGFLLSSLVTVGSGWGCNQYVFRNSGAAPSAGDPEAARHGERGVP